MKTIRNNLILLICLICTVTLLCIGCSKGQKVSDEQTAEQTQEAQTTRAGTPAAEEVQDSAQETVPAGESAALETGITISSLKGAASLEDASGESRGTQEGSSIGNGQVFVTEKDSAATISLDPDKSLYVDENTRVSFASEGKKLEMKVEEGQVLLDVRKKLGEEETLVLSGIALSGDIRGTIVYVEERPLPDDARATTLGVLEGTANVGYIDESGTRRTMPVPAGNKINLQYQQEDTSTNTIAVEKRALTREDIAGFVAETVNNDAEMKKRVDDATDVLNGELERQQADSWSAAGDWSWNETVTLVAQSASKMYDGTPLTRPSDVLVYGLPGDFSIRAVAGGSQTDAGVGANNIGFYTIFNPMGEDVTSHFPSIETVSGQLVVDPAPITIWTGSAEKVYDGTELTEPAAGVVGLSIGDFAFDNTIPEWRNSALETTSDSGQKVLYGVFGVVWVHGTNPLTGESKEIALRAGQRLTIILSDEADKGSIDFKTENLTEADLPEEVLRLYASKREMLAQACADTGWDSAVIEERIANLQDNAGTGREETLLYNFVDARINIDSDVTNYNERGLTDDEVTFVSPKVDESIRITATGSQTEAGNSLNTYEIHWGNANPNNYRISEELGTLTITPLELSVQCNLEKEVTYNGSFWSPSGNVVVTYLNGPHAGETVSASNLESIFQGTLFTGDTIDISVSGQGKDVGRYQVTVTAKVLKENCIQITCPGTSFEICPIQLMVETASASKIYDGNALTAAGVSVYGVGPDGETTLVSENGEYQLGDDTITFTAIGTITDEGETANTYSVDWGNASSSNYVITDKLGTLTVTKSPSTITLTAGSASKTYDGTALTSNEITAEGLPDGYSISGTCQGVQTNAGSSVNIITAYDLFDENGKNITELYSDVTLKEGELTVTPRPVTIFTGSSEKVYDGEPLTNQEAFIANLADGESVTVTTTGTFTEAGQVDNSYSIDWGDVNPSNYEVSEELGTLTITPLELNVQWSLEEGVTYAGVTLYAGSDSASGEVQVTYLNGSHAGETVSGQIVEHSPEGQAFFRADLFTLDTIEIGVDGHEKFVGSCPVKIAATTTKENSIQISCAEASFDIRPVQLMVETASASKIYDGNALTAAGVSVYVVGPDGETTLVSENGEYQLGDDTITFTAIGTITDEGETANTYSVDWGNASSSNYVIADKLGTLTVTKNPSTITLTAGSASKTYDGTALTSNEITAEGLPDGYSISGTCQGTQTDAGSHVNQIVEYRLFDETGKNITEFYNGVIFSNGTLTVTPAPLTITTLSDEKAYDGEPLTAGATISGLVNNETVTVTTAASVTEVNEEAPNTYNISWGTAKETNYTVTENIGTLKIVPLQIGVQWSLSEDLPYAGFTWTAGNGRARGEVQVTYLNGPHAGEAVDQYQPNEISLEEGEYMEEEDGAPFKFELFTGDIMSVTVSGESENAGTCPVKTTVVMDTENTARYVFSCGGASFEILPTKLTIVTDSAAKVYDGNSLTASGVKIYVGEGEDQFLFSENGQYEDTKVKITVTATGSITEIGTVENACDTDFKDDNPNYILSYQYGTLLVVDTVYEIDSNQMTIKIGNNSYKLLDEDKAKELCENLYRINYDSTPLYQFLELLRDELISKGYIE